MLWIADNLDGLKLLPRILVIIALFCFLASVAIAIIAVTRMKIAFAKDWSLAIANGNILQNLILKTTLLSIIPDKASVEIFKGKEHKLDNEKWKTLKSSEGFSKPEGHNRLAILYALLIIAGLVLYIFAQTLNAFC
jgi:ABC-type multidrug transport system fused ATPase/permease subunit